MHKAKIRALIFDYGDVISQSQNIIKANNIYKIFAKDLNDFQEIYDRRRGDYDCAKISGEEYWKSILRHYNLEERIPETKRLIQEDIESWTKIDDKMLQFIKKCRDEIYKLAIISNITSDILEYMKKHFNWLDIFDVTVFSCEVKEKKPNLKIYEICLQNLAVLPCECLFVDDSLENVKSAMEMKMKAIHYKHFNEFLTEFDENYYLSR